MSEDRIYARAKPSFIQMVEMYPYQIFISGNPAIQPYGKPTGVIEVTVPYDGYQSFDRKAHKDVKDHLEQVTGDLDAVIGHIAFAECERTDLDALLELDTWPSRVVSVKVPIRDVEAGLTEVEQLQDDRYVCIVRYDYRPEWPETYPLHVSIDLFDEDTVQEIIKAHQVEEWDAVTQRTGFREGLWLAVKVQVALPEWLFSGEPEVAEEPKRLPMSSETPSTAQAPPEPSPAAPLAQGAESAPDAAEEVREPPASEGATGEIAPEAQPEASPAAKVPVARYPLVAGPRGRRAQVRPRLTHMSLQWPAATSHRSVRLLVEGSEEVQSFSYNPDQGAIGWSDLELVYAGKTEGTDLHWFNGPTTLLLVNQPGELYFVNTLKGSIEVEVPDLLFSGLQARYFNALGYLETETPIEIRTIFRGEITLALQECFQRRVFSPYQRLEFDGVIFDELRLADIRIVLQDHRFQGIQTKRLPSGENQVAYSIKGTRSEGPDSLKLWVYAIGTFVTTERRTEIPGGRTYTTPVRTGDTVIHMRGELWGNSSRLIKVMNDIHRALKARFRRVAVE